MASLTRSLTSLVVFQNTNTNELIRSLHVYGSGDGEETEQVEREFAFEKKGPYRETKVNPLCRSDALRRPEISEGTVVGSWRCIFVFRSCRRSPLAVRFPSLLFVSRNPKLKTIPALTDDLQIVSKLVTGSEPQELPKISAKESRDGDEDCHDEPKRRQPVFDQDLNCIPESVSTSKESENGQSEYQESDIKTQKKKRAPSEHVAGLSLEDLAKQFGLPIVEASRNLKVGLTVLKKKCREFGIPRWPHRKIKSLDGLIRDLQEEAERQREKNKAAAMAVAKRQKMLEREKENIERKPFMEIQTETKRFRQDIFKRRHRATKALKTEALLSSST